MPEVKYVSKDSTQEQGMKIDPMIRTAKNMFPENIKRRVFYEQEGYVSIDATHYTAAVNTNSQWKTILGIGREGDGITTVPVTATAEAMVINNPHLVYEIYVYDTGTIKLQAYFSPTLNFHNDEGLKYGISIDEEQPQIISINKDDNNQRTWEQWVAGNIIIKTSNHTITSPGKHMVKYWMVNPAVVLQKIVMDFGELKPSYLGPPETIYPEISHE